MLKGWFQMWPYSHCYFLECECVRFSALCVCSTCVHVSVRYHEERLSDMQDKCRAKDTHVLTHSLIQFKAFL